MKLSIIGTGYVGLVSGACLAEIGNEVVCIDINEQKINNLKKGIIPIYEPGLEEIIERNTKHNRLFFSTNLNEAIQGSEAIFIAVGTPPGEDGSADLKYVLEVAKEIGQSLNEYAVIIMKSTVPVGTVEKVKNLIQDELNKRNCQVGFDVASNPEFLKEGDAVNDFLKPDRIIIGIENEKAKEVLSEIYQAFTLNGHPIIYMDIVSAELTKYAANAMLAARISFMNDMANLCDKIGANINDVRKGIGSDPRIGNKFLNSGVGYGGSCFPKDVKALINIGIQHGHPLRMLQAVDDINITQRTVLCDKILMHFNNDIKGKKIAIWGLTYKPNTDDMREAPSIYIIDHLLKAGAEIAVFDPIGMESAKNEIKGNVEWACDIYAASKDADAIALVTEWNEFRIPDWNQLKKIMRQRVIFDGRNVYDSQTMRKEGFEYYGIGQK